MIAAPCLAEDAVPEGAEDGPDVSALQKLLDTPIYINKREERLLDAAAAVYVIKQEDLKRTGATSIAEALRMVPGFEVGRITSNKWSIGARGFCDIFSNKLLVLMDGRSVYSPLFSGVLWDLQDTMLEDIDRIEVIRGPGAAVWGANAVNGVVNVITKRSNDTTGKVGVLGCSGGDQTQTKALRYGGQMNAKTFFRFYAKDASYDDLKGTLGGEMGDSWGQSRGGFRLDYQPSEMASLTVQGDLYNEDAWNDYVVGVVDEYPFARTVHSHVKSSGNNLLMRWNESDSRDNSMTFQAYYDKTNRFDPVLFGEERTTIDVDYQREFHPNELTSQQWGFGYRRSTSDTVNGDMVLFKYRTVTDNLWSAFFQDEQAVVRDRLKLIVGAKLEHNDYTGLEFQPNARFVWTPSSNAAIWGAVSKAVRTPSVADFYSLYNIIAPPDEFGKARVFSIINNPDMKSEKLTAYELGYRIKSTERLALNVSGFWNFYDDLRSLEPGAPWIETTYTHGWEEHRHLPFYISNNFRSNSRGIEASVDYVPTDKWRLRLGGSAMDLWVDRSRSFDITGSNLENTYPKDQFSIISYLNLSNRLSFDTAIYRVGSSETPVLATAATKIPAYTRVDARIGYKGEDGTEWDLGVKNLTDSKHLEAGSIYGEQPSYIGTSWYLRMTRSW